MSWSLKLCRVAGIEIFVHWTFLILIGWILMLHLAAGHGLAVAAEGILFVLAIFTCIVLHELGHGLAARRFGIGTIDITLLPIGGVARLERMPEEPAQELWVASAGPAVNLVIAAVLLVSIEVMHGLSSLYEVAVVGGEFLPKLMWVNVSLVAFNLLPAFPMDGGRMLRALLAYRMDYARATRLAATVGQGAAVAFGILGLFVPGAWLLLFVALFVFVGAEQEARMVLVHSLMKDAETRAAMMTRFKVLAPWNTLGDAANELLASPQEDFPVLDEGRVVGVLPRNMLIKSLADVGRDVSVGRVMRRDFPEVHEDETLERTFENMREHGFSSLPVMRNGYLVGVVTMENIGDWMMVQSALERVDSNQEVQELLKA